MHKHLFAAVWLLLAVAPAMAQDTLWVRFDNRFEENKPLNISQADSVEFRQHSRYTYPVVRMYSQRYREGYLDYSLKTLFGSADYAGTLLLRNPGRILYKPSAFSTINFETDGGTWSFARSMESEHFVVFWEPGFGPDPTRAPQHAFNPRTLLAQAERVWQKNVDDLGFLVPGHSTTDKYKMEIFVHYQSDWMANGSGYDNRVGAFNVSPGAIGARGGHTVAHEIGHCFQYLVSCDLGMGHGYNYGYGDNASGGNGWWESCANWQGYKCFPERQFTDGEYFEGHLKHHHLNLLHEDWRYDNCFIQDYWCMKHGQDFIGRLWRQANKPEDPVETYQRLNNLTQAQFCDEQMEGCMRMATWDIDGIREAARHRIGQHQSHLTLAADGYWQVDSAYCPQNYGYNIINLNTPEPGQTVKAHFQGIAGAPGYRAINADKAGWRYGFVAYTADGERRYGNIESNPEGTAMLTVPDRCTRLFFVVMGAPTEHWRHPWDDNAANDEQWPYRVRFEQTDLSGHFDAYPADYERRDTTVYIDAELRVANDYSSTRVQYDLGAVSKALGLSTAEMKAVGRQATDNPRFVGVNAAGTIHTGTTTTTSSSTVYGHWFTSGGDVCGYDGSACLFAEFYPDSYGCYVGQYPGRLRAGQTYTVRQAIQYEHAGRRYTATMVVRLKAV